LPGNSQADFPLGDRESSFVSSLAAGAFGLMGGPPLAASLSGQAARRLLLTKFLHGEEEHMADAKRQRLNGNGHAKNGNGHHGANGNGNGNGNGHAAPTISMLQAELATGKAALSKLAAERDGLALAAVRGDPAAQARIAAIDAERQRLANRAETLQAAVRALHDQQRAVGWRRFLPRARKIYRQELRMAWATWPARLAAAYASRPDIKHALDAFDELERETAKRAANLALPDSLFAVVSSTFDKGDAMRKLQAERARLEGLVVDALLADEDATAGMRPPPELDEALQAARRRLAAGAQTHYGAFAVVAR
jgi:hypothetical protein